MNTINEKRPIDDSERHLMRETLDFWSEVPRGAVSEHSKNDKLTLEGSLRRQWAAFPGKALGWREGLVAGNGRQGLVFAGAPWDEVLIFQNVFFVIPTPHPRFTPPAVGEMLQVARTHVMALDDDWFPERGQKTTVYPFHPGEQLRIRQTMGTVERYERATVMDRGELTAITKSHDGVRNERHFVSADEDVIISEFEAVDGYNGMDLQISPDLLEEMEGYGWWKFGTAPETQMPYWLFADEKKGIIGLLAHYPDYEGSELAGCGFVSVNHILTDGKLDLAWEGIQTRHLATSEGRPLLSVTGAKKVQILSSSAVLKSPGLIGDYPAGSISGKLDPKTTLGGAVSAEVNRLLSFAETYPCERDGLINYDRAVSRHAEIWRERMHRQELSVGMDKSDDCVPLSALFARQKEQKTLSGALVSRLYRLGRYSLFCCAGYTAPRLCGIWTGEWNPAWSGAYTMDANVNLQVSGMNLGNMPEAAAGYCRFVQKQIPDWTENARLVYGMKDALLVPVNTDGLRAMMVEYDSEYPFEYWNAGAAWMIRPIFETWQCFGDITFGENERILENLLRPLLRQALNFWNQYCTPEYYTGIDDKPTYEPGKTALKNGEKYLLVPGYSPENHPGVRKSSVCMNTTMDICAARDTLSMVRTMEALCPSDESGRILQCCDKLDAGLPQYLTDATGALKEWANKAYNENNAHRHLSHLYCAWPSFEIANNAVLAQACIQSVANRDRENEGKDDTPSHGWIHKMLILARLRQSTALTQLLRKLLNTSVFYATGMTDHNTDRSRSVFCTDTLHGLQGVIQEMLLYTDGDEIELLPSLPNEWKTGSVKGLITRSGVRVDSLVWDTDKGVIKVELDIQKDFRGKIKLCPDFRRQGYVCLTGIAEGTLKSYPAKTRLSICWNRRTVG